MVKYAYKTVHLREGRRLYKAWIGLLLHILLKVCTQLDQDLSYQTSQKCTHSVKKKNQLINRSKSGQICQKQNCPLCIIADGNELEQAGSTSLVGCLEEGVEKRGLR